MKKGDKLFSVKQTDKVANFYAPIDGFVSSVNSALFMHPDIIEKDPYV